MLSTKDTTTNKTKKSYTFTLNQEQMEEFKRNNPNLNVSGFLDTVIRKENIKEKIYPFQNIFNENFKGVSFNSKEEEQKFDEMFGLSQYYYDDEEAK
jgi:hypothetical protein